jgi:hypothetical protein
VSDALPGGLSFVSATPSDGTSYNAGIWTIPSLANGAAVTLSITATVNSVGTMMNTAEIIHSDQFDPDDTNNQASVTVAAIFDPPSGRKTLNSANLPELDWRMVWINSANNAAINVQITDPIPPGTTYVTSSLLCEARGSSTTTVCTFDSVNNRIFWQGVIGPDLGASDEASASNEIVITFRVTVPSRLSLVRNQASSLTDTDGDGDFTDETTSVSVSRSNQAMWRGPVPVPSLSPAALAVAIGVLMAVGFLGLRRTAREARPHHDW